MHLRNDLVNKIHLIISVVIVVPTAIIYGFFPDLLLQLFPSTMDEMNFFKAVMGLYLAFSTVWILGLLNPQYFKLALLSNIVFMLGLGVGRTMSLIIDGIPSNLYLFGAFAEIFLGLYGIWVFRKKTKFDLK